MCISHAFLCTLYSDAAICVDQDRLTYVGALSLLQLLSMSLFSNRLFGTKSVIRTDCSSTWKIIVNPDLSWYHHANPILLLAMYYTLATLICIWLQEPLVRVERV
jgi:hypothetical protein